MNNPFLVGGSIYLRPLEPSDANEEYVSWLNDEKVCEFNSHHTFPYTLEMAKEYIASVTGSRSSVVLAIIDTASDEHIGNVALQNISWVNRSAEFAILIGKTSFMGKGIGKEAGKLMMEHGFNALNLHRIYCGTASNNIAMQKLAVYLNMEEEGRRKEALFKNERYYDIVEYGCINSG